MADTLNINQIKQDTILMSTLDYLNLIDQVASKTANQVVNNLSAEIRSLQEDKLLSQDEAIKTIWSKE